MRDCDRPPALVGLVARTLHASTQLPVRVALLVLAGFFVLAEQFGFENILGAFAAGMVVRAATQSPADKPLRDKIDAVAFGWFVPFFFVGTGNEAKETHISHHHPRFDVDEDGMAQGMATMAATVTSYLNRGA